MSLPVSEAVSVLCSRQKASLSALVRRYFYVPSSACLLRYKTIESV
jgi:hypothetical protein